MEGSKKKWYYHWYVWSLEIWDEFSMQDSRWQFEDRTNLCHFIRVTFMWAPLVLALHAALLLAAVGVLTAIPIYYYGLSGYLWIIGVGTLVVGLPILAKWLRGQNRSAVRQLIQTSVRAPDREIPKPTRVDTGPSFFSIIWSYLVALKQKTCPTITFT